MKIYCWVFVFLISIVEVISLRYDFGDGRYYVGNVDEFGKPSGHGQFFNSSGALGLFHSGFFYYTQ